MGTDRKEKVKILSMKDYLSNGAGENQGLLIERIKKQRLGNCTRKCHTKSSKGTINAPWKSTDTQKKEDSHGDVASADTCLKVVDYQTPRSGYLTRKVRGEGNETPK